MDKCFVRSDLVSLFWTLEYLCSGSISESMVSYYESRPFLDHIGIEVTKADGGMAEGKIELREYHSWSPNNTIVHGGVTYALADTVGGAAVVSLNQGVTPTIDMRIDYLSPATGNQLAAKAEVVREGSSTSHVDVSVMDGDHTPIAECRGVFKTSGGEGTTPWTTDQEDS